MKTNVLLITYRRSTHIASIIDEISKSDVEIFVYSNYWADESVKKDVKYAREIILEKVKEGKVQHVNFTNKNLSVEKSIPYAIDWFFDNVTKGIILEDDCIPTSELALVIKHIMPKIEKQNKIHINLNHKLSYASNSSDQFVLSNVKLVNVWGWASNAYTWNKSREINRITLKEFLQGFSDTNIKTRDTIPYYIMYLFNYYKFINTWDFIYAVNVLNMGAEILQVHPNLIDNRGADIYSSNHHFNHELNHASKNVLVGYEYDEFLLKNLYRPMLLTINLRRVRNLFRRTKRICMLHFSKKK